jgi:thioredoxin
MKNTAIFFFTSAIILLTSCSNGQSKVGVTNLSVSAFADKLKATPTAIILDVRTPDEFESGHLLNAINMDWNGNDFTQKVSKLNQSTPVFIYCLAGSRSASAATEMRKNGFKEVYEMAGGMMKWRAANLPETTDKTSLAFKGMTELDFEALLIKDKIVLVDFYAEWCGPCKKMKPYLDEISKDMAATVTVIRIDVDANPALCKELKIEDIPVLQVYKNGNLTWKNVGFIEKESVLVQLTN